MKSDSSTIKTIAEMLAASKGCVEHPVYHPEGTLNRHVLIVAAKALLLTGNKDLVLAALLHDVYKPLHGYVASTPHGSYWSNPKHAQQAAECDVVAHAVWSFGGHLPTVLGLIRHHMDCKTQITKAAKSTPLIDLFVALDDMVGRKALPETVGDVHMPGVGHLCRKRVQFVGQSPIQREYHSDMMTVTVSNTPIAMRILDVPQLFKGKWAAFQPLLKPLV